MNSDSANTENTEFSFRSRKKSIQKMKDEKFDLLIIGGGITGAATARDAAMRGLKVALVEKNDFAFGTSSRSSKLIHGGLRYLENMEFGLVFEALSERTNLLKTVPHMVKPLPFYFPVYKGDSHGRFILSLGMWLYDLLALFRAPGFHNGYSKQKLLKEIPHLKKQGLKGGFRYFDASVWDDVLTVEILRDAHIYGACVANYVKAVEPIFNKDNLEGFRVYDKESDESFDVKAQKVIVCAGPWTDLIGEKLSKDWKPWLNPSKGVHLVFDAKKIPVPGAMVMSHPKDGRISFVIPRDDFGDGVVIVGTTDSPVSKDPEKAEVENSDVEYLLDLINLYFPGLEISKLDVISAYVGVRPLIGNASGESLQKVSREHQIDKGPGGCVIVAGGKYTTHRTMAAEIVDFALKNWKGDLPKTHDANTRKALSCPPYKIKKDFSNIEEELRFEIQNGMVMHLEDFYLRRTALFIARKDHGLSLARDLAEVFVKETGKPHDQVEEELQLLEAEFNKRDSWR